MAQAVIADVMKEKGVSVAEIPNDRRFGNNLDCVERSKRYFRCKAFAKFGDHKKDRRTTCQRHWASAHAWCVMDLKTQQIIRYFSQKCQTCEGSADPEFDGDALKRMAEWAVDTFLRRTGRLSSRREPSWRRPVRLDPELTDFDCALDLDLDLGFGFRDVDVDLDDSKGPHDQARCGMCSKLGRSCWK